MNGDTGWISYFKRFKMERDLTELPPIVLPSGYDWIPWSPSLLELHATTLAACFQQEIDATVFRSLGNGEGCLNLMREICRKPGFLAESTWLVDYGGEAVGTVQGVCEPPGMGAIQNLGILPRHRGKGLGSALLLQALHGFRLHGLRQARLEVTAHNEGAVRLYQRLGFRRRKVIYKPVENAGLFTHA
jgi:hypothetical protein